MLKYFFLILIALHSEACTPLAPRPEPTPPPIDPSSTPTVQPTQSITSAQTSTEADTQAPVYISTTSYIEPTQSTETSSSTVDVLMSSTEILTTTTEKVESVCKNRNEPLHVDRMDFIISGRSDSLAFDGTLEGCIAAVCEIYSKGTFFELSPRLKSCRAFTNAFSASRLPGASDAQVFFMGDNSTSAKDALTELCYQDPRCTNLDA